MQNPRNNGFTLIELLVVIAIIAILAGLLLPAVNGVKKKGYEARARTEVKALETAIKAYLNEYNRYPEPGTTGGADKQYGSSPGNAVLIEALKGVNANNNPRKIAFLEMSEDAIDANDNMIDPWDNQYRVALDLNFDNIVQSGDSDVGNVEGRNVIVWSIGQKGDPDSYIKSWE